MDVVAGLTIVPMVLFLAVAFVRHPGPHLVKWVRTFFALCLLACGMAAILLPRIGRPVYLVYFAAGTNLGVETNDIFACVSVFVMIAIDARYLETARALPINHAETLLGLSFYFALATWSWVKHRGLHSLAGISTQTSLAIAFNALALVCVTAGDLVPVSSGVIRTGNNPAFLVAAFVLGRNADRHRGVFTALSAIFVLVAAVLTGMQNPLGLTFTLPLLVCTIAFFFAEHQILSAAQSVGVVAVLAWTAATSFVVFAIATRFALVPNNPTASLAIGITVLFLCGFIALAAILVLYADAHERENKRRVKS